MYIISAHLQKLQLRHKTLIDATKSNILLLKEV